MAKEKNTYKFKGGIYCHDRFICNWEGQTYATSQGKARSNLAFQARQTLGLAAGASLRLVGQLTAVS